MQSGFRGFLLTSKEIFLNSYNHGLNTITPLIMEQRALVSSPKQKKRLDSILVLHLEWVDYANALIATKMDTLPEASEKYKLLFETKLKMEVGKNLNDDIRVMFTAFDSHEYSLRQLRRRMLEQSIISTGKINLTLTLFSISFALVSCFYIVKIITKRISTMVYFAEEISRGNFKKMEDNKNDELKKLSESLNSMSQTLHKNFEELTKKNKELDQFAYIVSHDLKAPLRGISNITKWIEEDYQKDITPDIQNHLNLIKGRTQRLENMINGLLEYAKIGKVTKGYEEVHVGHLVKEIIEDIVPASFEVSTEGDMPMIVTEKLRLEQVFSNLISNAVKYTDKAVGKIKISSHEYDKYYEFSVSDNGQGIQPEYYEKIFIIFQTLRERDAFESTGVGLAIVKKIIDDQKAVIHVESKPEKGTTFKFTWPKNGLTVNK
jgi:signal transduction histidine kinase